MESQPRPQRSGLRRYAVLAWLRLARVFQQIDTRSERFFRREGLNTAQFDVLAKIGAASGLTQQELADALLVTKGNICQLLDRLEEQGMLVREQEGRSNRLYLTEHSRRLLADVVPSHEAAVAARFAALSTEEQATLLALLRKLDQA